MIELRTDEIAAATGGTTAVDAVVSGVSIDSRRVRPGDLFVALKGTRVDGAQFAAAAIAAGAAAVLTGRDTGAERAIVVDDPLLALGRVAREVRMRSSARVVGITGSTGKTSTKDILLALVEPHRHVQASRENENTEIGVPLTLARIEPDTEVVIAELAMRGIGQIAYLGEIALPDIALVTSIGPVHLELLGTVERVAEAKAEILHHLADDGVAIVPHGESLLEPHVSGIPQRVITFGEDPRADVVLTRFVRTDGGGEAEIRLSGRTLQVPVNFTSRHNAINLAAAAAAYDALGLPVDELPHGATSVRFSRWRGEEISLPGGGVLLADCYNANPTSMRAAIEHLVDIAERRRRVVLLGDMAELGDDAPRFHGEVGELLEEAGIDQVVGIGPLARGYGGIWFADRAAALEALPDLIRPGDAVLVKASRSMGLEELVEAIAP
jgi:UDP-N-acetylmuramoyl-tripeptide--D-alanyl-D-alanine ligase